MSDTRSFASRVALGNELEVRRIGYGAMQLTGAQVWGEYPDRKAGIALLQEVVELGITFIDTADVYGPHSNELLIHDALYPYRDELVIATKGGFVRGGYEYSTLGAVGNRNYLRQSAHMSARRLGVDRIDLYYLHSGYAEDAPFEEQVETLAELRDQGLIRNIGLSNVTADQFRSAQAIVEIAAVTGHYNIAVRAGSELLRAAEAAGVAFSPWHPATVHVPDTPPFVKERVQTIARRYDATSRQVALAWQLGRSPLTLPIPGTTSLVHLRENLAAERIQLTPGEIDSITALTAEAS